MYVIFNLSIFPITFLFVALKKSLFTITTVSTGYFCSCWDPSNSYIMSDLDAFALVKVWQQGLSCSQLLCDLKVLGAKTLSLCDVDAHSNSATNLSWLIHWPDCKPDNNWPYQGLLTPWDLVLLIGLQMDDWACPILATSRCSLSTFSLICFITEMFICSNTF